jgi:hypothetical protein
MTLNFKSIENLNTVQKWLLVVVTAGLVIFGCDWAMEMNRAYYSPLFLYYIPLALSVVLLGLNITGILTVVMIVFSFLNLYEVSAPVWVYTTFILGLMVNYFIWYRWGQDRESQAFQRQKSLEELELNMNDTRLSHEKVRVAHQANLIKIQRYTALNELARSLAMTFKTQDVVVLLIETISKTFMVPGGVYTLLLFDSSIGKALHAVRYSVDTEMDVRLNRERLSSEEAFNAWFWLNRKPCLLVMP